MKHLYEYLRNSATLSLISSSSITQFSLLFAKRTRNRNNSSSNLNSFSGASFIDTESSFYRAQNPYPYKNRLKALSLSFSFLDTGKCIDSRRKFTLCRIRTYTRVNNVHVYTSTLMKKERENLCCLSFEHRSV